MKEIVIKVSHKEAIVNSYFIVNVEDYWNKNLLSEVLENLTKYDIKIVKVSQIEKNSDVYRCSSLERCFKRIIDCNLYRRTHTPVWGEKLVVIPFKLSAIFKIADVGHGDYCTFFLIKKDPEIKDVDFNDKYLKEKLDLKIAVNGYYYMVGDWKFYRSHSRPSEWEARKTEKYISYFKKDIEII